MRDQWLHKTLFKGKGLFNLIGKRTYSDFSDFETVKLIFGDYNMELKHAELIKKWAEGATIQCKDRITHEWVTVQNPGWYEYEQYRIKPEKRQFDDAEEEIESILDCFDFYRVKQVMDFLDWAWWDTDGVPEIWDLRKRARQLLRTAAREVVESSRNEYCTSTGGFFVTANTYPDTNKIYLKLSFELEGWDNFD